VFTTFRIIVAAVYQLYSILAVGGIPGLAFEHEYEICTTLIHRKSNDLYVGKISGKISGNIVIFIEIVIDTGGCCAR
jgi:hypothetical protein